MKKLSVWHALFAGWVLYKARQWQNTQQAFGVENGPKRADYSYLLALRDVIIEPGRLVPFATNNEWAMPDRLSSSALFDWAPLPTFSLSVPPNLRG